MSLVCAEKNENFKLSPEGIGGHGIPLSGGLSSTVPKYLILGS